MPEEPYHLADINDCSIADLYRDLLNIYDNRFKERQYVFQLTEEYLPDEYLFEVYNDDNVKNIEYEIDAAIKKYVSNGCSALGINIPDKITSAGISQIINELDEHIKQYDIREDELKENQEYQERRQQYEHLLKELEKTRRNHKHYEDELEKNENKKATLEKKVNDVSLAEAEKKTWIDQRNERIANAKKEFEFLCKKVEKGTDIQAPAKYARQLYILNDLSEGNKYIEDENYLVFLNEYCQDAANELNNYLKDKSLNNVTKQIQNRKKEIEENLDSLSNRIKELVSQIEETESWLRNNFRDEIKTKENNTLIRSEMERSRFFLSRIESTVFEQEVWKALSPIKEKYGIKTLDISENKDGKRKESRILYKADLLFYIKIYMKLHPETVLPDYRLICIDEGQDLHSADYDILHNLYPDSTFNVFGDINQVLHLQCGITDWKKQTNITDIYPLDINYRNSAAIVDFCINKFDIQMKYFGKVSSVNKPTVLTHLSKEILSNELTVIVKSRREYSDFCQTAGIEENEYIYLDTLSEKSEKNRRECYSVFAAKGLEFKTVLVYAKNMTINQKVVACTRAMGGLYYYE